MKKKKILKGLGIFILVALVILFIFSIIKYRQTGNQQISIATSDKYYLNDKIETAVAIESNKIINKGTIKAKLLNSDKKTVKKTKQKIKIDEEAMASISIELPNDLEPGKYYIEIVAKTNLGRDKVKKEINIQNAKDTNATITMDKGIYKPGDEVNYRALITYLDNDEPVQEDVKISIYDGNENRVYVQNVTTSDYGIVSGTFKLANEVNSGKYQLKLETKGQEYIKYFNVNPYVTPKYGVEVISDKKEYLVGETANITVKAEYFFGEKVKNAEITANIAEKEYTGKTDENGEYSFEYKIENTGKFLVSTKVIDESNYMIEESASFSAGTDIFEIEVLPAYGNIKTSVNNDIYILTKKADGTPIKTYITLTSGKLKRQVITDESGIGKLELTSSDIDLLDKKNTKVADEFYTYNAQNNYQQSNQQARISIIAEDMEGHVVDKKESITIDSNYGTLLNTDKVKYNVGDDIQLNINSSNEKEKIIYSCKNDKVINMITTSEEEVKLNFGDTYGLVDIFVLEQNNNNYNYDYTYYRTDSMNRKNMIINKKTIFIKPNKELNIDVQTDKDEYSPKDTMKLTIGLSDEKSSIDGALLVSILDEAVLSLADNDISIDNVKLALSDIEFTEDLSAADVYSNIVDDKSETTLMGLLLKQNGNARTVKLNRCYSEMHKYDYESMMWTTGICLFGSLIIAISIKYKVARKFLAHLLSISFTYILIISILGRFLSIELNLSNVQIALITLIVTFIFYVLFLEKKKVYLFRFVLQYGILSLLFIISYELIENFVSYRNELAWVILVLLIIPIIYTVIILLKKNKKNVDKIEKLFKGFLKDEIILFISVILFRENCLIAIFILDYVFENIIKHKKNAIATNERIVVKNEMEIYVGTVSIILILLVGMYICSIVPLKGTGSINTGISSMIVDETESIGSNKGPTNLDLVYDGVTSSASKDITSSSSSISSIIDSATDFISKGKDLQSLGNSEENEGTFTEEKETSEDENIRNVFLESLCFIPELVTQNGQANKDIKLSDNITTWQIQVVGNTKNGRIGYANNSFRVFKEFFVDFNMPTNSVVGDKVSIPLTVYNYTENALTIHFNIAENSWFKLGAYETSVYVEPKGTKLVYIPIEILTAGENTLRIEAKTEELTDIVEKTMTTEENGIKISNVLASGTLDSKIDLDILYLQNYKEGTGNVKVKLYSTAMSQTVEGLENIFRMPTGCFEQVSSSLYPDILVLKYLENKDISSQLKQKAMEYIETGYQKLLTYEVAGEKGGYSLYGRSPAEIVLTAYGLMEFSDLSEVYSVEDNIIENMKNYVFSKQKSNGSFDIKNGYMHGIVDKTDQLTLNAYITWTLSECFPEDERLEKSVKYLEEKIDDVEDSYTLALIANVFANTNSKKTNIVIQKLVKDIKTTNDGYTYMKSNVRDYYGTCGNYQNLQTTALTSLALTKTNSNSKTNLELINYIISRKDINGTWGTTQATILSLKALIEYEGKTTIGEQDIKVSLNSDTRNIKIEKDNLDIYQEIFNNVQKENQLTIEMKKGKLYYEVIQEYYIEHSEYDVSQNKLQIEYTIDQEAKVNDILTQNIKIANTSGEYIENGMIEIRVPQGCSVREESLSKLEAKGIIEKYEYSYGKIYAYIRQFNENEFVNLEIQYKADYPSSITGGSIHVYDYYNPDIQAIAMPTEIIVK